MIALAAAAWLLNCVLADPFPAGLRDRKQPIVAYVTRVDGAWQIECQTVPSRRVLVFRGGANVWSFLQAGVVCGAGTYAADAAANSDRARLVAFGEDGDVVAWQDCVVRGEDEVAPWVMVLESQDGVLWVDG